MHETELKPGEETTFTVGDQTLRLRPLPFGRMKKLLAIVVKVIEKMAGFEGMSPADIMRSAPEIIGDSYAQVIPLLFDPKEHPFINDGWIEENLTIPLAKQIAIAAVKVNGLEDFFGKMRVPAQAPTTEGSPSDSSITSSPQPTDGQ